MRRRSAFLVLVGAVVLTLATQGAAAAQSDGNGLEEISRNTFRIDPDAGFVRVDVTISLRNVTTDRRDGDVIRQRYFDGYGLVVPAGAENIVARAEGGAVLDGRLVEDPLTDAFALYDFDLPRNLYAGDTTTVTVSYDHRGLPPRSEIPWRSNAAYSSLVAFGGGDSGDVTIEVVLPDGYELDEFSDIEGFVMQPPDEFGTVTYRAEGLDEDFGALISLSNDDRLISTPVAVDGVEFVIESWPGDEEWITFTEDHLVVGVPGLEQLIGSAWPVEEPLAIRETVEPAYSGYAGWFDAQASEIAVGEELDADTVFHELSHAWFNRDSFVDRWLYEGLAQTYAAEMVRRQGGVSATPAPLAGDPDLLPLVDWSIARTRQGEFDEDVMYPASWFVVDAIVDEIGFDSMREILATGRTTLLYGDRAEASTSPTPPVDWMRAYDLFDILGGSTVADDLFRRHVLDPDGVALLDERAAARLAYDEFAAEAAPWSVPLRIRRDMDNWNFDDAIDEVADARQVLTRRADVARIAARTGVTPPNLAAQPFANAIAGYTEPLAILDRQLADGSTLVEMQESIRALAARVGVEMPAIGGGRADVEDFTDAIAIGRDQLDALGRVGATIDAEARTDDLISRIGLLATDVPAMLDEARAALEAGDTDAARVLAAQAQAAIDDADDAGRTRALVAGIALAALVAMVLLTLLVRRRRRSGGGAVDARVDRLDARSLDLDEDALAGAGLGGVDHRVDVAAGDHRQASGTARVVQRHPALGHIGDPVLELHEDIGAVVDANPVSGAEVLIDPDTHGEAER